jgi:hypothetical protein
MPSTLRLSGSGSTWTDIVLLTFSHQELPEPGAAPYGAVWPELVPVSVYNNFIFIPYKLYNLTNPDS